MIWLASQTEHRPAMEPGGVKLKWTALQTLKPLRCSGDSRGAHPGVEVWPDEEFTEGGWSYASIVSRFDGKRPHSGLREASAPVN